MNIYLLSDPLKPARFAAFSVMGTWSESRGPLCEGCGDPQRYYTPPLEIEWMSGTDRIGDFSWGSYTCLVVDRVRDFLIENSFECTFAQVEMLPLNSKSMIPRVTYPYKGPAVSWLRPTETVKLNPQKSNVRLEVDCPLCGNRRHTFKSDGIYIDKDQWQGEKIFRIEQNGRSEAMFITDLALGKLEGQGFSNLCSSLAGEIAT